jgi:hypothetical protein
MEARDMMTEQRQFPPLPKIGMSDEYYAKELSQADAENDPHSREALKVARYISLALHPKLAWDAKLRYFQHALHKHCASPTGGEETKDFYQKLAETVREYCGSEALRLASQEDDMYAARAALSEDHSTIEEDAEVFFGSLLGAGGDQCPDYFNDLDWTQLKMLRDQWI